MKILAIETSCDETALCLLEANKKGFKILKNLVSSQVKIHAKYGGIVPEVAARKHVEIMPLLLKEAKIKKSDFNVIAVTSGPGLITSLMVGVETAKTLSFVWDKPLVAVNHLEGHIYSNWLSENNKDKWTKVKFPTICLIVSGGHTQLVLMKDHQKYEIIGETQDDAAGEAFDKVAKLLNLGYPGGPVISKWAGRNVKLGLKTQPNVPEFPRPLLNKPNFDFSFSGLKTSVLYFLEKQKVSLGFQTQASLKKTKYPPQLKIAVAREFQNAVVEVLVKKTIKAAKKYDAKTVMLGGGVAANQKLRQVLSQEVKKQLSNVNCQMSIVKNCGDNAAMIAVAGYFHALKKNFTPFNKVKIDPNWQL